MAQWTPSPPGRAFCMLPPRQCVPSQGRSIVEPTPFSAWENFYVIIGSSAAALTGLQFVVVVLGAEHDHHELQTDRKSTRLNSSHGYISYAVFCLKKKKKQTCHD